MSKLTITKNRDTPFVVIILVYAKKLSERLKHPISTSEKKYDIQNININAHLLLESN